MTLSEQIESAKEGMTAKQIKFCEQYIIDLNQTQAAIRSGYSEKTASSISTENLRKPKIKTLIPLLQKDLEGQTGLTPMAMLLELKNIALTNPSDIYDDWITVKDWDEVPDNIKAAISEIHTETVKHMDGSVTTKIKVKFHAKITAIQEIGKRLGQYEAEKSEVTIKQSLSELKAENERLDSLLDD